MASPHFSSLQSLVTALRSGSLPLLSYLDVLEKHFTKEDARVHAFVPEPLRFARLRMEAGRLLEQFPDEDGRPALFGVPVGVKDIFHVQGFVTRAGSRINSDVIQGDESVAVQQLKDAGALILGKTVTTEFAYFAPGPTRNPRALDHTPGGSSSGSAAAVAAGLCPLALGTQTIGSINRPAAFCGVVGYKPSFDRVSKAGVIPLAPSADHVGFFVPQAADAQIVAAVLCENWQPATSARRPLLGVPDGPYLNRAAGEGLAHFNASCRLLADAGFAIKHVALMPDFDLIETRHNQIVAAEAAQVHGEWYARYKESYHPRTAELIERGLQIGAQELQDARRSQHTLRETLSTVMDAERIDLWLSPSATGAAPPGLESTGNPILNLPWTHAGVPTITLPAGHNDEGLPLGLQLAARWCRDEDLLAWAPRLAEALGPLKNW